MTMLSDLVIYAFGGTPAGEAGSAQTKIITSSPFDSCSFCTSSRD